MKHNSLGNFTALMLFAAYTSSPLLGQNVDNSTLTGKVLVGYQGWFRCPGDGSPSNTWSHWFKYGISQSQIGGNNPRIWDVDLFPDVSEMEPSSLCDVPGLRLNNGKPVRVFSSFSKKTTDIHFRWMRQYGIDGVLIQRFVSRLGELKAEHDMVLMNALKSAEENGRVLAVEYDATGSNPATALEQIQSDWGYLTNELKITKSKAYLHDHGKPVVSLWGIGFSGKIYPQDPRAVLASIKWFKSSGNATVMGGIPAYWAALSRDSFSSPEWAEVYKSFDVIQPWSVGRYKTIAAVETWNTQNLIPDLKITTARGQGYMPVIFPGFSWHNRHTDGQKNEIARKSGDFLWLQAANAKLAGATMVKIAMFDELNEGTPIFKLAATEADIPRGSDMVPLDADGDSLPSDWYLELSRKVGEIFKGEEPAKKGLPLKKPNHKQ